MVIQTSVICFLAQCQKQSTILGDSKVILNVCFVCCCQWGNYQQWGIYWVFASVVHTYNIYLDVYVICHMITNLSFNCIWDEPGLYLLTSWTKP
jgi:hypothetical protein